jgi:L-malate glycosyltransferase
VSTQLDQKDYHAASSVVGLVNRLRVAYLNHTARIGGAEESLLNLLRALPPWVEPLVACPRGELANEVRRLRVRVWPIQATELSLKLHMRRTPAGIIELGLAARSLRSLLKQGFDAVHANSARAALIAAVAGRPHGVARVAHIRDALPDAAAARATRSVLLRTSDAIIFVSRYTADRFLDGRSHPLVNVIHNPVDIDRFSAKDESKSQARRALGLAPGGYVLAMVAQITPWKAQDDAVKTVAALRDLGLEAQLLLVGSTKFVSARYDNAAYEQRLHALVGELNMSDRVRFLGERSDVPAILQAADMVLVPSWEEPFGRTVVEAMAMHVPVAATEVGGPSEILQPGVQGLLLPPRQPAKWARALKPLLEDAERRTEMGCAARERVLAAFTPERHAQLVCALYQACCKSVATEAASAGQPWAPPS